MSKTPHEILDSIESHTQIADFFQEADRYVMERSESEYLDHLDRRACSYFAHKFFDARAFMRKELAPDDTFRSRRFRWRMTVLMPEESHFDNQLAEARREGEEAVLAALLDDADALHAAGNMGPAMAFGMKGFVETYRRKMKEKDDERRRAEYERARGTGGGAAA